VKADPASASTAPPPPARPDPANPFDLARVRAALDAAGVGVWEFDPLTGTIERSGAHDAILGYPLGHDGPWDAGACLSHVLPEDRPLVEAAWAGAVARREPLHLTYRIRRACDGRVRWVEAHGIPWPDPGAEPLRYLGTLADVTERHQEEEQKEILLSEMRHRVKNILANVQSLALHTGRQASSVDGFLRTFGGRLTALAHAHDLAVERNGAGATLAAVARAALEPWQETGQIRLPATERRVTPRQAVALSLALHELATNAVKHGALSHPAGQVAIETRETPDGRLVLTWQEMGGPPPRPEGARGFGSRLLQRALPVELSGTIALSLPPQGARCEMTFPLRLPATPDPASAPGRDLERAASSAA
jgi:two-component sensor histidine kinase